MILLKHPGKTVVVVGCGNIGSHLVSHLGRIDCISRVTLVDKDVYEPANLASQDIAPRDVGKSKVTVQSRRLVRIGPRLRVEAIAGAVEGVPLGKLRANVILSCLDSRVARQHVNQFAWRLGVPMIDAGVEAGGLLARINVYVPGFDNPCLECAWDDRDYEALEQTYPCQEGATNVDATNVARTSAPSSLGALAASLQAIECHKLLLGQTDQVAIGQQVLIDALHHRHFVTSFRRNPDCRFRHDVWRIQQASRDITLREALALGPSARGNHSTSLKIEGKPFVTKLVCAGCGHTRKLLRLECSLRDSDVICVHCGQRMRGVGFDLLEELNAETVPTSGLGITLRKLGLRTGDVFGIGSEHYEISHVQRREL
jgi:molybdopterin/thiamine biosynthesis adenylyltransferase